MYGLLTSSFFSISATLRIWTFLNRARCCAAMFWYMASTASARDRARNSLTICSSSANGSVTRKEKETDVVGTGTRVVSKPNGKVLDFQWSPLVDLRQPKVSAWMKAVEIPDVRRSSRRSLHWPS